MNHVLHMLPFLFAAGIAGTVHCAGMCGGLVVLTVGARRDGRRAALGGYLAGKAVSYLLLGALAGAAGEAFLRAVPLHLGAKVLAAAAAVVLAWMALESFGIVSGRAVPLVWLSRASGFLTGVARDGGVGGALLIGMANAFLPCPLVWAFLAMSATAASPVWGAAVMLILGVTSSLALAIVAAAGERLRGIRALPLPLVTGALMLLMAFLTLYRGFALPAAHGHHSP